MPEKTILLDVDGVLADFVGGCCQTLVGCGYPKAPEQIEHLDLKTTLSPNEFAALDRYCHLEGWCSSLKWYPSAKVFVEVLKELGRVYAVTAHTWSRSGTWCRERTAWLEPYIKPDHVIYTPHKYMVHGDVLIEDSLSNLHGWKYAHPKGTAILIDRPWNQSDLIDASIHRVSSFLEAANLVRKACS